MGDFAATSTPDAVTGSITLADGSERVVWRQGTGRPLLLIMGMSGTHDHWGQALIDGLVAAGRALVCINHRGIYRTPAPEPGYTVADLADDQAAALDALGVNEPIDVFGISMGGMIGQELALRHPTRVRTLALGCTTAGGSLMAYPSGEDLQHLMAERQSGDLDRALRAAFEMNVSRTLWADEEVQRDFFERTMRAPVSEAIILGQLQAIATHDTVGRLGQIAVPVAVLHGTLDRMLPYPNGTAIAEAVPGAQLTTFDDAGHLFFWDHAPATIEVLAGLSAHAPA